MPPRRSASELMQGSSTLNRRPFVKPVLTKTLAPVAVAVGLLFATSAQAEVEYHGYFRTQAGGTAQGGNLQCFDAGWPTGGAGPHAVGRLGNECDAYGDAQFALGFGDPNAAWGKYHIGFAYKNKDANAWEATWSDDGKSSNGLNIANENNWFEAGGFFPQGSALENASVWVGKRHYNRHDVHITDNYYWSNSGVGAGIDGIKLGSAKTALAYLQRGGNANASDDVVGKRYALRVYDIDANPGGKVEGELVLFNGSTAGTGETGSGSSLMLQHTQGNLLGGFNKLALVLGKDAGAGFTWVPTYAGGDNGNKGNSSWAVTEQFMFDLKGTNWSGMVTAGAGEIDASWGKPSYWNLVVRPQYNFTKNFSIAAELGHVQGKNGDSKPTLTKFTIAPQLTLSEGFWARPVVRAFVTHARWSKDAGTQANGVFGSATSGTTFGVQAEAWW